MAQAPTAIQKSSYPLRIKVSLVFTALLFLGWVALLGLLWMQGGDRKLEAIADGRRISINVNTSAIEGNVGTAPVSTSRDDRIAKQLAKIQGDSDEALTDAQAIANGAPASTRTAERSVMAAAQDIVTPKSNLRVNNRPVIAPLAQAPISELEETLAGGLTLPRISDDGELQPWSYYSKPYAFPDGSQLLSIVITDLGINPSLTQSALNLDEYVTLAFSPYATAVSKQIDTARLSGFETWLMFPLQHEAYPINDYGPLTLLSEETREANITQLHRLLGSTYGYSGLIATHDERFSRSNHMNAVYGELVRRGIAVMLYNKEFQPESDSYLLSKAYNHLHGGSVPEDIARYFREVEAYTKKNGSATITISPLPAVMSALPEWINSLKKKNIQLVPLSAQSKEKQPRS